MGVLKRVRRRIILTCRDVNDFLTAYHEGELEPQVRKKFDAHIGRCSQCTEYLKQYTATVEMVKEADSAAEPPPELVDYTLAFLREHYGDAE